ncbi:MULTISPECIES: acyl carrier protein [unclassified Sphingobacterium]|uniref:acyl carrier protein n=1 Tax=unclassified Sphingobacterium TaxID=2609468 RepID=UPI001049A246|nr:MULTISPECIES: acyl carrier protein [unclassified Sphingobacterium]MCS3556585.1 acyl carrier protein [Sphingobacterium sp. JUb21]TCQ99879.1 acyl carrier protein [Sphingobacterium sp. JUb20]
MNNTEKLHQAFINGLSISENEVHPELAYQRIAAWDSMSHIFLITTLEETFHIRLETEDILEMSSYSKIIEVLKKYDILF